MLMKFVIGEFYENISSHFNFHFVLSVLMTTLQLISICLQVTLILVAVVSLVMFLLEEGESSVLTSQPPRPLEGY
jgi:type III secretory pathway component EscT